MIISSRAFFSIPIHKENHKMPRTFNNFPLKDQMYFEKQFINVVGQQYHCLIINSIVPSQFPPGFYLNFPLVINGHLGLPQHLFICLFVLVCLGRVSLCNPGYPGTRLPLLGLKVPTPTTQTYHTLLILDSHRSEKIKNRIGKRHKHICIPMELVHRETETERETH